MITHPEVYEMKEVLLHIYLDHQSACQAIGQVPHIRSFWYTILDTQELRTKSLHPYNKQESSRQSAITYLGSECQCCGASQHASCDIRGRPLPPASSCIHARTVHLNLCILVTDKIAAENDAT
jgi:hypothetical protein